MQGTTLEALQMNHDLRTPPDRERPHALVWIDSHEAIVVRWEDGQARIDRVTSEVPDPHRSTGHIRHDPAVRHGGSAAQDVLEARRQAYLTRFLKDVTGRLPDEADLTVLGPGETHEHLLHSVRAADADHHRGRRVVGRRSSHKTDRQLVALLRELEGDDAPRREPGEDHPSRTAHAAHPAGKSHREAVS
jgi:hypothetical protein